MSEPNSTDCAEIALDEAMRCVTETMLPWTTKNTALETLKDRFRSDFQTQIKALDTYQEWRPRIERLYSHVGAVSAFIAEARQKNVGQEPGEVTLDDLVLACQLVRLLICPVEAQWRICTHAPMFAPGTLRKALSDVTMILASAGARLPTP